MIPAAAGGAQPRYKPLSATNGSRVGEGIEVPTNQGNDWTKASE